MKKTLLPLALLASSSAFAADYTDGDTHKNDYKWMQGNLMYAVNELPGESDHDYLELEFGGRAGILDYYGYADVFNLASSESSDKDGADKIFIKFAPRISLDGLTGKDLSFGPVEEVYFATLFNWSGGSDSVNNSFWGIGSDVMVPWLGKVGLNVYGLYDLNEKEWNGYQVSTNWFKPFYFFENGSFISYQGYIDYQFGYDDDFDALYTDNGGAMFNGIYWHSDRFAVGYGLKAFKDAYALVDGGLAGKTTGLTHYFAATYKF
ncbi:outer membrane protein OmpK [Psychromonas sp. 14N.309.X.WAT.B.A12]|uniref:nucleoside-specific channel-forming Tsx family protein n=1 Tax=unclassified Psychromonas TaxID=2614957 RepID=UPI0025B1607C|nr:outer membrane protein OmpK [Psychromonas sp. 14N.309.X.WAT.B.A12]MDN2664990.1 outer membrane protein OmpK [Psychromonas sp. 14N.309.X.WAT.B.A12]